MSNVWKNPAVGELRPSQMIFTFGVGAIADLPNLSTMIMGLEDWPVAHTVSIGEERLLISVRHHLGDQVQRLSSMPRPPETTPSAQFSTSGQTTGVGVPVASFPRWMRCPWCSLLAPLGSGLFQLKTDPYRPERSRYVHSNCQKPGHPPTVLPARFLVACENGHLDDFPWAAYAHGWRDHCNGALSLAEHGASGAAADVFVRCNACGSRRSMAEAFGKEARASMPLCSRRWPHLRQYDEQDCGQRMRSILLGASNSWFPVTVSALSLPSEVNPLGQVVEQLWVHLHMVQSSQHVGFIRSYHPTLAPYTDEDVWSAIQRHRQTLDSPVDTSTALDLRLPEWQVFSKPDPKRNTAAFHLAPVAAPRGYESFFEQVVLAERLREVNALIGFTRINSPGDFDETQGVPEDRRAPLSRNPTQWVPATEVHGEGIFLQLQETLVRSWCDLPTIRQRAQAFLEGYRQWRKVRRLPEDDAGFPGMRYVLLHSLSHALMRQLSLECGYSASSVRERIYSREPEADGGPMAGILLYTAAPDSEGTLGGLVSLGEPGLLARHLGQALEQLRRCASDPLCAEHAPSQDGLTLHATACHACLFAPETSCERGNKFLDRAVLTATMAQEQLRFFR